MNSILKCYPRIYFKGMEEIKSIELLDNGVVLIRYTLTDEYMKEWNLIYKERQLQLDPNEKRPVLKEQDYAIRPEESNEIIYHNMKGNN